MKNSDYVFRFEVLKQTRLTPILHSSFKELRQRDFSLFTKEENVTSLPLTGG